MNAKFGVFFQSFPAPLFSRHKSVREEVMEVDGIGQFTLSRSGVNGSRGRNLPVTEHVC
jgi:hypothetical protein